MSKVEVSLRSSELSGAMAEMRMWLDARRFEPSVFCCREEGSGFVVLVDFKVTAEAGAFADRFSGQIGRPPAADGKTDRAGDFSPLLATDGRNRPARPVS